MIHRYPIHVFGPTSPHKDVLMDTYHVVHDAKRNTWCVNRDDKKIRCFAKKHDAIDLGWQLTQGSIVGELAVHDSKGSVEIVWDCRPEPTG